MRKRKSILFYFDNYWLVADLPDEQLGLLFRVLMEYGELEANGQSGAAVYEHYYPYMTESTRMAFTFMADTIRRDAATYSEKSANYREAAQRRHEARRETEASAPQSRPPEQQPRQQPRRADAPSRPRESHEEEMSRYVRQFHEKRRAAP